MKIILLAAPLILFATFSYADCFPTQWKLPNKGQGCQAIANFGNPQEAIVWSCKYQDKSEQLFLMTGRVSQQSEGDACFVVKRVVLQSKDPVF
jgi:hypothetical protein